MASQKKEGRKKMKMLQGHQRVVFRFLRSSYEKVDESEDFWQGVLQFGWEFIQQSRKKTIYQDILLIWQREEK